ncbi:MAG: hypothetical protein JJ863_09770 [Deltaproteobacteria bacterium]|nr:hypothetical protein [Deltaproteobacteria bacterium]
MGRSPRTLSVLTLAVLGCGESAVAPAEPEASRPTIEPAPILTPPPSRPTTEACQAIGCAIGLSEDELELGPVVSRQGRWVHLEGEVSYQLRDGLVAQLRLAPCTPLRGEPDVLEAHGFTLNEPSVRNLRDARELVGIVGHRLEGRGSSCFITAATTELGSDPGDPPPSG